MSEEKEPAANAPAENNFSRASSPAAAEAAAGKKTSPLDVLKFVAITAAIVLPVRFFIAQPFLVSGPSMIPTFNDKDYLIVDELSYRFEKPKRGEVIIFKQEQEGKYLIKRIVGLPGETLTLSGKTVTIKNAARPEGFALDQSFLANTVSEPQRTVTLDDSHYFVLGDNRPVSYDSRGWGPLPAKDIVGRPLIRLYPFDKIGMFPGYASL